MTGDASRSVVALLLVAVAASTACGSDDAGTRRRTPSTYTRVPHLSGLEASEAKALLRARGLKVRVTYDRFAGLPPGTVIDEDPNADTLVRKGSTITIEVARRRKP